MSSSNEPHCESQASSAALSRANLEAHDLATQAATDWIVVRIEVKDTGCGIRYSDMEQTKLFCMSSLSQQSVSDHIQQRLSTRPNRVGDRVSRCS